MKPVYSDQQKSGLNREVVALQRSKSIVPAPLIGSQLSGLYREVVSGCRRSSRQVLLDDLLPVCVRDVDTVEPHLWTP